MKYDITGLGELLIDFTPRGKSDNGNTVFEANPGGAPPNALSQASRLGKRTAFIGKVGCDTFGEFLRDTLVKVGINTDSLVMTKDYFTTLAFVTLSDNGERSFSFARTMSADVMLSEDDINEEAVKNTRILHIGTLSLTHESARRATVKALDIAKKNGVYISVDPNLRLPLWESEDKAREAIRFVLGYADIVKISDYEVEFLCRGCTLEEGALKLYGEYSPKIMFVTCGKDGAFCVKDGKIVKESGFEADTVDTTGAGDSFCGASLSKLIDLGLDFDGIGSAECSEILKYANAAASVSTEKYGAVCVMPREEEFSHLL